MCVVIELCKESFTPQEVFALIHQAQREFKNSRWLDMFIQVNLA